MKITPIMIAFLMLLVSISTVSSGNEENETVDPVQQNDGPMEREHFIENQGQISRNDIRFYSLGSFRAGFTGSSVVYAINGVGTYSYEVVFVDANHVEPEGVEEEITKYNYFLGNDPDSWVSNAPSFEKVLYEDLWNGIDLMFYCDNGYLKYDLIIEPRASVEDIRFMVSGADIRVTDDGSEILFNTPFGEVSDGGLIAYQESGEVPVSFEIDGGSFSFSVEDYNENEVLVIDPLVKYCTYLGGSGYDEMGKGLESYNGEYIISGQTPSKDFPTTIGTVDSTLSGYSDLFITVFDNALSVLKFSTFLGGSNNEYESGMDIDPDGNVYITGYTYSTDLPTTSGAMNETSQIGVSEWGSPTADGFIFKIDPTGSSIEYCSYIPGSQDDYPEDLAVDDSGCAYVTGITNSENIYTVNPYEESLPGFQNIFLMKLDSQGSSAFYSTYFGGSSYDYVNSIEVDANRRAVITGSTNSFDLETTSGAYKTTFGGRQGSFLTRFSATGSSLDMSTYLTDDSYPESLTIGSDGIWIIGETYSSSLPVTEDAYQKEMSGNQDVFVLKMSSSGSSVLECTYLGGSSYDYGSDITIDTLDRVMVCGRTSSTDLKTTPGALYGSHLGKDDGFFVRFVNGVSDVDILSYFYGSSYGSEMGLLSLNPDEVLLAGGTSSMDLPTTPNAYDRSGQSGDLFLVSIKLNSYPPLPPMNLSIERGDSSLDLSWDAPLHDGNETVTNYTLYRSSNNWTFEKLVTIDATSSLEYTDPYLDNGDRYYYYVTATNIVGESIRSVVRSAIPARSPSIPEIKSVETGDRTITLEWDHPEDYGGDYDSFFSVYSGSSADSMEMLIEYWEDLDFTHTNLTNGQTYFYSISATNSMGEGGISTPISAVPMKTPSSPMDISIMRGSGFIHLFWEAPSDNGGEEELTYNVYMKRSDNNGPMVVKAERLTKLDLNITNLVNGKYYDLSIRAENEKGEGPDSDVITAKPVGIPGTPRDIAIEVSNGKVLLTWKEPFDIGGDDEVTYDLYRYNSGSDPDLIVEGIESEEYRISGLENGVTYDFFVTARNTFYESERSSVISGIPVGPPTEPVGLVIEGGDTTSRLTWSLPLDDGGDSFLSFEVYMGPNENDLSEVLKTKGFLYNGEDLTNGKTYYYGVRATNSFGPGPFSEIVSVTPMTKPGIAEIIFFEPGNGTIHMDWSVPVSNGGYSDLRYNIYLDSEEEPLHLHVENVSGTSYTLTELTNGVEYKVGITAFNPRGEGLMTDTIKTTPSGPPPDPLTMSLERGKGSITVKWELPEETGGMPIYEVLVFRWKEDEDPELIATVDSSFTEFVDETVKDEEKYNYMVVGKTESGITPNSNIESQSSKQTKEQGFNLMFPAIIIFIILFLVILISLLLSFRKRNTLQQNQVEPIMTPQEMQLPQNIAPAQLPTNSYVEPQSLPPGNYDPATLNMEQGQVPLDQQQF